MACVKYIWPVLHFEKLMENVWWGNWRQYSAHIRALIKCTPRLWQRAAQVLKHEQLWSTGLYPVPKEWGEVVWGAQLWRAEFCLQLSLKITHSNQGSIALVKAKLCARHWLLERFVPMRNGHIWPEHFCYLSGLSQPHAASAWPHQLLQQLPPCFSLLPTWFHGRLLVCIPWAR